MTKPKGYWNNYEHCYEEAKKYTSKNEFKHGNSSAYNVSRKNKWIDDYNWFEEKVKQNGYWNYEHCHEEARKYKTRKEFQNKSGGSYRVALENGWLDDYTWFEKLMGKWNRETCFEEAKKFNSRTEFYKNAKGAYNVARKNGWLDDYDWIPKNKRKENWTKEKCYENAKNYKSKKEFQEKSGSAYNAAWKNKWLDDYTWFEKPFRWTYDVCYEEAGKYSTLKEFRENSPKAYSISKKNKWIDNFDFLYRDRTKRGTWQNYDNCYNEAKKYTNLNEFRKNSFSAYSVSIEQGWLNDYTWLERKWEKKWDYQNCKEQALKVNSRGEFKKICPCGYASARHNGWLDDFVWLKPKHSNIFTDKIDYIYCYEFTDIKTVYVGRTIHPKIRDKEHIWQNDTVSFFCKEHNISIPEMKILEDNLTLEEGTKKECFWIEYYKNKGWILLNKAKGGSLGSIGRILYTKEKCYEIAKKCTYKSEMKYKCYGAYRAALKRGWIKDYIWFENNTNKIISQKLRIWTREKCMKEALKYESSSEFRKKCCGAYCAAKKNGWFDNYTWLKKRFKWTEENCRNEALKYKSVSEFKNGNKSAYTAAKRYKWLKNYTWFNKNN